MLTIEHIILIIFEAHNLVSSKHMSFWYPFLEPHKTTYHSNIRVSIKKTSPIRHAYLKVALKGPYVIWQQIKGGFHCGGCWCRFKQASSCKSVSPYYYPPHVTNSGRLSNQGQTLTHLRDHFRSTLTYNWTSLEAWVTKATSHTRLKAHDHSILR